ncbi:ABC transporter substrate-binding protein [Paenibacillus sp. 1P07SE]|uniref:ABC transporter substrate-binding protein n=1 Tax=Paenibacillus sp. 1P07SE TaxID=3132209 RepID=UPI0039A576F5
MKRNRLSGIIRPLMLGLVCSLAVAGCGSTSPAGGGELEQVRMASWSQPISEQTHLLSEPEYGWFAEAGIDLEFIPGAGGGDAIKHLLSGQADIAFTDPGSLFFALDKGEALVAIYNIYPQNVFNVVALQESGIQEPEDLRGKTIGVYSLASGTRHNLLMLLSAAGIEEDEVTIVETGVSNFLPLMQGQVDATAATDTGLLIGLEKGLGNINVMEVKDFLNMPSDLFVVTEEVFREKEALMRRFLQAYQASAAWMLEQPEEAAELAIKHAIDGQDKGRNRAIIEARNAATVSELTESEGLGALETEILQQAADAYYELGLIENRLDMESVIRDDLLPGRP